jgi:hypothetical protein
MHQRMNHNPASIPTLICRHVRGLSLSATPAALGLTRRERPGSSDLRVGLLNHVPGVPALSDTDDRRVTFSSASLCLSLCLLTSSQPGSSTATAASAWTPTQSQGGPSDSSRDPT